MRNVYVMADNIYSPVQEKYAGLTWKPEQGRSGIRLQNGNLSPDPFYASLFDSTDKIESESKTFFEQIVFASALDAIQRADIQPGDKKPGLSFLQQKEI